MKLKAIFSQVKFFFGCAKTGPEKDGGTVRACFQGKAKGGSNRFFVYIGVGVYIDTSFRPFVIIKLIFFILPSQIIV